MLSVFFILCFLCLVRCLCRFLAVFFLGSLFETFSGANFCVPVLLWFVVLNGVLLVFLFDVLVFHSRTCFDFF